MSIFFFNSATSLRTKLKYFYALLSTIICIVVLMVFFYMINWTENHSGRQLILLDATDAIGRYEHGESGIIHIGLFTIAYDNLDLVPPQYAKYIEGKESFLGEVEKGSNTRLLYYTEFKLNGKIKPLILLSKVSEIELHSDEFIGILFIIFTIFGVLFLAFAFITMRLSQKVLYPIHSLSKQLQASQGNAHTIFTINNDAVVEFIELTTQLNAYRAEIVNVLKREQLFARCASHELRTPLAIVKGANTLLDQAPSSAFQARQISKIKKASNQMINIIEALLSLVRYERNYEDMALRTITKAEIQSIIDDYMPYIENKKNSISLTVDYEPKICASMAIIRMIIGNLIQNAISATENGKIEVRMDRNSIAILDEGSGITVEHFKEGHGLGILLIKMLCERFEWTFSLDNREEKGCIAKITLA